MKLDIIYEDEFLIACVKPCGVPSQGDKSNDEDMVTALKNYIFDNADSDEEPYIAVINRLDRPVGGIIIFAKTPEIAAKLSDQMQDRSIKKYYQAVLTGELPNDYGDLEDYLVKDSKTNMSRVAKKGDKGAKLAKLSYEVLDVFDTSEGVLSYILIELETGRHHQIRVQMAERGCGIWGDTKYNPKFKKKNKTYKQIGLYASRLELSHPVTNEKLILKCEPLGEAFDVIEMDEFE